MLHLGKKHLLVSTYAGGPKGELLDYSKNPSLGSEYCTAVVEAQFSKCNLCVFVKLGLFLANLTTVKVQDGFAKLVLKSDVVALEGKQKASDVIQTEEFLVKIWGKCSGKPREQAYKAFGRCMIRSILLLRKKEKHGREPGKKWDLISIEEAFDKDLEGTPAKAAEDKPESNKASPARIEDASSAIFVATSQVPLTKGSFYIHKDPPREGLGHACYP